jgi:hypothetical protein
MKNKIIFFMGFSLLMIFLMGNISAWGPHTHNLLSNSIFESDNPVGELCGSTEENRAAYRLGSEAPDLTVIYYYSQGGKEYRLSHNWNFQQEIMAQALTDDEKCFAWGIASHLIADGIAHTEAVPEGIITSKIPNWMSHPLLEKKYDSYLVLENPELLETTPHMMDALFGPRGDRYVEMMDKAMGSNSEIDVKSELTKLAYALNTFYDGQFKPQGQSWIFKSYPYIDKFTNFLAPIIGSTNAAQMDNYYDKSKLSILNTFTNWGARYQISPHGFEDLSEANEEIGITTTIIFLIIFAFPIGLYFFKRKRTKKSWRYLLLIPLFIIIGVVVVYILL